MLKLKIFFRSALFLLLTYTFNLHAKEIRRFKNVGLVEKFLEKQLLPVSNNNTKIPDYAGFWDKRRVKNQIISVLEKEKINKNTIKEVSKLMTYNPKIHDLRFKQPEFVMNLDNYHKRIDLSQKISDSKKYLQENRNKLKYYLQDSDINPEIVVALLAMETNFGKNVGRYNVIEALYTMSVETQKSKGRQKFFIDNILACAKLHQEEKFDLNTLSSWSGAVGNMQFMPSNLLAYGVAVDGKMDVYDDRVVYQSVKNYLTDLGWKKNGSFLTKVILPMDFDVKNIGIFEEPKTVAEFKKLGIKPYSAGARYFSQKNIKGDLIVPDFNVSDLAYPRFLNSFIVYENFHVIFDWNRSLLFGVSVGLIYESLKRM